MQASPKCMEVRYYLYWINITSEIADMWVVHCVFSFKIDTKRKLSLNMSFVKKFW